MNWSKIMNAINLFEANIIYWIENHLRVGFLTPIMQAITALGNGGAFWIVLTVLLLLFQKTRRAGICCALALILDLLAVNIAIKPLVARIRPYQVLPEITLITNLPGDYSFPSGHSAASFAAAWALFRSGRKKWGAWALALAALIALSRLYVGVHYPTDVLGGTLIGFAVAEVAVRILRALSKKHAGLE